MKTYRLKRDLPWKKAGTYYHILDETIENATLCKVEFKISDWPEWFEEVEPNVIPSNKEKPSIFEYLFLGDLLEERNKIAKDTLAFNALNDPYKEGYWMALNSIIKKIEGYE